MSTRPTRLSRFPLAIFGIVTVWLLWRHDIADQLLIAPWSDLVHGLEDVSMSLMGLLIAVFLCPNPVPLSPTPSFADSHQCRGNRSVSLLFFAMTAVFGLLFVKLGAPVSRYRTRH
ncbi:MAG: hypothetical protein R3B96_24380 [Pirellulaceae bacterium]